MKKNLVISIATIVALSVGVAALADTALPSATSEQPAAQVTVTTEPTAVPVVTADPTVVPTVVPVVTVEPTVVPTVIPTITQPATSEEDKDDEGQYASIHGIISAVSDSSITIQKGIKANAGNLTFTIDATTKIKAPRFKGITASNLKVGTWVNVRFDAKTNKAVAINVIPKGGNLNQLIKQDEAKLKAGLAKIQAEQQRLSHEKAKKGIAGKTHGNGKAKGFGHGRK